MTSHSYTWSDVISSESDHSSKVVTGPDPFVLVQKTWPTITGAN